jgi:hypothetical protein
VDNFITDIRLVNLKGTLCCFGGVNWADWRKKGLVSSETNFIFLNGLACIGASWALVSVKKADKHKTEDPLALAERIP